MIPRPLAKGGQENRREIFKPATLAQKIQASFDDDFGYIWLEGEISELSIPFSGHAYFCLKDSQAKIRAVMWKGRRAYAGAALAEGQSVLAKGRLAVYAPRGEFQLVADYLEPRGEGALRLAYEKLKAKLAEEGLFDPARKRPLPYWPERVAVISSATGAALSDFLITAKKRRPGAHITVRPVRVQGPGAAAEIAAALGDLNAWGGFDLIVLTRGGGSLADLWAFNEEAVARAVAASRTPTLAAIGHSTDVSLAELAADAQAITPTAAAEAAIRDQAAIAAHLDEAETRLARGVREIISQGRERSERASRRLGSLENLIGRKGQDLDIQARDLARAINKRLIDEGRRLDFLGRNLTALSPQNVLKRGYAVVTKASDGCAVKPNELTVGEDVTIRWAEARALATIKGNM